MCLIISNHKKLYSVTWHINTESSHSLVDGLETKQSLSYLINLTPPGYRWISLQTSTSSGKLLALYLIKLISNLSVVPFICWCQSSLQALSASNFVIAKQDVVTIFQSTSSDEGELLF